MMNTKSPVQTTPWFLSPLALQSVAAAGGMMVTNLLLLALSAKLLFSPWAWLTLLPLWVVMSFGVWQAGKRAAASLTFKQAFSTAFQVAACATLIYTLFFYLELFVFRPDLLQIQEEVTTAAYLSMMKSQPEVSEQEVIKGLANIKRNAKDFNFGQALFALLQSLLLGAIPAMIAALVFKNQGVGRKKANG